ncbi:arsinothricin resistance N-acetyltransferase ArsN1 family B [Blastococcus saxobsidens]|nr:arsinothricin resistance N-acetyltransferase ArsN1 family B [Blastococcus saxobsidens]
MGASATDVRDATPADAAACAAIYAPYVTGTTITFELEPPTGEQMAGRIATAQRAHAWLVLEDDGVVVGYAYAGPYKERAAYRWSCEASVYLDGGRRRRGGGRALYEALFARLSERGFRTAVAGITLPNEPSIGLHTAMGFELIGTYRRIGFKQGRWRDVLWMQRSLGPYDDEPGPPA